MHMLQLLHTERRLCHMMSSILYIGTLEDSHWLVVDSHLPPMGIGPAFIHAI